MLTGEILRLSAARHPDKVALIHGARRITYGALDLAANRFANALLGHGIGKGDRVAIISRNLPEYVITHFGNARSGALLVNVMPAYAADEMLAILTNTAARLIVVEEAFQERLAAIADRLPGLEHIVVIGTPDDESLQSFETFIEAAADTPPPVALDEAASFAMTFTGGTTGLPKGAVVSHRARFASACTTAIEHEVSESDIVGLLTPFYHAMGSVVWLPTVIYVGATAVMLTGWDVDTFVEETERHGISNVFMVPVQLRELLDDRHFDKSRLISLRRIACGGAITPADLVADINRKMPDTRFTNHFGQSETGPICVYRHDQPRDKAGTVGRRAVGVELAIVNQQGRAVAMGEAGEIITRGPFLMDGYYNNAPETAVYFRNGDGWGWTGDLATEDEDGFITLVGRSKDMIVSGGVNIYPREVELALERHEAIADCTVFGIPDEKWGEALVAYVVTANGHTLDEAGVIDHCTRHLARFKRPKVVRLVEAIPKTPSGKVQKPRLRESFLAEYPVQTRG
jgi:acyl-CoA synthetase (AMP-forming)/AMP-acid ligase II